MDDVKAARRRINPKDRKNELRKEIADCQKKFLRIIVQITGKLHAKNKRDGDLAELREQISIAVKDAPEDIFKTAGEYVWEFREDIRVGNVRKFLGMDFTEEVEKNTIDSSEVEQVKLLITKIKRTWRLLGEHEQKELIKDVQRLVAKYAQWQDHKNQLKGLKAKK
jgi:hypothetical protein